jgi:hypothetical protein
MAELYLHLNDPNGVKNLRIVLYDPKTHREKTLSVLESDKKEPLFIISNEISCFIALGGSRNNGPVTACTPGSRCRPWRRSSR